MSGIFWFMMRLNAQKYNMYENNIFIHEKWDKSKPFVFIHNQTINYIKVKKKKNT